MCGRHRIVCGRHNLGALGGSLGPGGSQNLILGFLRALGRHFGGLGVPLGAFGAQSLPKTASPFHARSLFSDFDAQREPEGIPKWSPNRSKNIPKIN